MYRFISSIILVWYSVSLAATTAAPCQTYQYVEAPRIRCAIEDAWQTFGYSLVVDGTVLAISAVRSLTYEGQVYLFRESIPGANDWTEEASIQSDGGPENDDRFGHAMDLNSDTLVVGKQGDNLNTGAAYVIREATLGAGNWAIVSKLTATDGIPDDLFGYSVTIHDLTIVVSSPKKSQSVPSVTDVGCVYVFMETSIGSNVWNEQFFLYPSDSISNPYSWFGWCVDMDAYTVAVGAWSVTVGGITKAGQVYLMRESSGAGAGDWAETSQLVSNLPVTDLYFGRAVSIVGTMIAIGCDYDASIAVQAGSVYLFTETVLFANDWSQLEILIGSGVRENSRFGYDLVLTSSKLLIGGYNDGGAWLYNQTSPGVWEEEMYIGTTWEEGSFATLFGGAVAMTETTIIVADSFFSDDYVRQGTVYYFPLDCGDDCIGHTCHHGSTCMDEFLNYTCDCLDTYDGEFCEIDLCAPVGYAENGICNCTDTGATGTFCEIDIDDCVSSPCANAGICSDMGDVYFPNKPHEYNCTCSNGFSGPTCTDTLCVSSPCLFNGLCENGVDLVCNCDNTGYTGDFCQTEVNECESNPCLNDGVCIDLRNDYECNCTGTGFEGDLCQTDMDDCASSPCYNNATCKDKGVNKFRCTCPSGYEGTLCETDINDCLSYPCLNGGQCYDAGGNMFMCDCSTTIVPAEGMLCDIPIDLCLSSPCLPWETCAWKKNQGIYECKEPTDACLSQPCLDNEVCEESTIESAVIGYVCIVPSSNSDNGTTSTPNTTTVWDPDMCNEECIDFSFGFNLVENVNVTEFIVDLPKDLAESTNSDTNDYIIVSIGVPRDIYDAQVSRNTLGNTLIPMYLYTGGEEEEGEYMVDIVYLNPDKMTQENGIIMIENAILDPTGPIAENTRDARLVSTTVSDDPEEDDDDENNDNGTDTMILIIMILASLIGVLFLAYIIYRYNNTAKKTLDMRAYALPA